jgi:hypothetical protein
MFSSHVTTGHGARPNEAPKRAAAVATAQVPATATTMNNRRRTTGGGGGGGGATSSSRVNGNEETKEVISMNNNNIQPTIASTAATHAAAAAAVAVSRHNSNVGRSNHGVVTSASGASGTGIDLDEVADLRDTVDILQQKVEKLEALLAYVLIITASFPRLTLIL